MRTTRSRCLRLRTNVQSRHSVPHGPHPPLGIRVGLWRPVRGADHVDALEVADYPEVIGIRMKLRLDTTRARHDSPPAWPCPHSVVRPTYRRPAFGLRSCVGWGRCTTPPASAFRERSLVRETKDQKRKRILNSERNHAEPPAAVAAVAAGAF